MQPPVATYPELVKDPPARRLAHQPLRRFVAEVALVMIVLLFGSTLVMQTYVIPTTSMETTMLVGDHILVDKLAFSPRGPVSRYLLPYREIQRGDIAVFRWPVNAEQVFIKRVIGLPGDRIKLIDKAVFVNGRKLTEPYVTYKQGVDSYRDSFPAVDPYPGLPEQVSEMFEKFVKDAELTVPGDCFFMMGDNRDLSLDSRFWGVVPRANMIGKPMLIYWSYQSTTERLSGGISLAHWWDIATNLVTKTRWQRTGNWIHGYKH
jgi:signal peptidase I